MWGFSVRTGNDDVTEAQHAELSCAIDGSTGKEKLDGTIDAARNCDHDWGRKNPEDVVKEEAAEQQHPNLS